MNSFAGRTLSETGSSHNGALPLREALVQTDKLAQGQISK